MAPIDKVLLWNTTTRKVDSRQHESSCESKQRDIDDPAQLNNRGTFRFSLSRIHRPNDKRCIVNVCIHGSSVSSFVCLLFVCFFLDKNHFPIHSLVNEVLQEYHERLKRVEEALVSVQIMHESSQKDDNHHGTLSLSDAVQMFVEMQELQNRQLERLEAYIRQQQSFRNNHAAVAPPPLETLLETDRETDPSVSASKVQSQGTSTQSDHSKNEPDDHSWILNRTHPSDEGGAGGVHAAQRDTSSALNRHHSNVKEEHSPSMTSADPTVLQHPADDNDDEETYDVDDDDSAKYCVTIPANKQSYRSVPALDTYLRPLSPSAISEVHFVTSPSSVSVTNITFDDDDDHYFHDHNATNDVHFPLVLETVMEEDQSVVSRETPVLDRYRLAHDERSPHGFVVLPNPRRHRHSGRKQKSRHTLKENKKPIAPQLPATIYEHSIGNATSSSSSSSVTNTAVKEESTITNHLPSLLLRTPLSADVISKRGGVLRKQPQSDFRHSLAPSLLYAKANLMRDTPKPSVLTTPPPAAKNHPSAPTTDMTSIAIKSPPPTSKRRHDRFADPTQELESNGSITEKDNTWKQIQPYMKPISKMEYDNAPRIVHLQVEYEELITAVDALNDAIHCAVTDGGHSNTIISHVHVSEAEAHLILTQSARFVDVRKRKNILFALCSLRRLIMRNPNKITSGPEHEIEFIFDIVGS